MLDTPYNSLCFIPQRGRLFRSVSLNEEDYSKVYLSHNTGMNIIEYLCKFAKEIKMPFGHNTCDL